MNLFFDCNLINAKVMLKVTLKYWLQLWLIGCCKWVGLAYSGVYTVMGPLYIG